MSTYVNRVFHLLRSAMVPAVPLSQVLTQI